MGMTLNEAIYVAVLNSYTKARIPGERGRVLSFDDLSNEIDASHPLNDKGWDFTKGHLEHSYRGESPLRLECLL